MARAILAVVLVAMGVGQLSDLVGFFDVLDTYDLGGRGISVTLGLALIAGEVVGGAGLLSRAPSARHVASAAAVGVAVLWTALGVQAFARGLVIPNCGCFGVHLAQELRWWILLEDLYLIALTLWVRRGVVAASGAAHPTPSATVG